MVENIEYLLYGDYIMKLFELSTIRICFFIFFIILLGVIQTNIAVIIIFFLAGWKIFDLIVKFMNFLLDEME